MDMLLNFWNRVTRFPFGRTFFNCMIARTVPYTGSISPRVIELSHGNSHVQMRDRKKVRNHLNSIHAIALMNLGEFATGLAVMSGLPSEARAILVHLEIDFLKKARGTIQARATFQCPAGVLQDRQKFRIETNLTNDAAEIVATVKADWLIGPKERR
jgi:acyl-coenzyme A thioesterase PaaI-like protein